MKKATLWFEQRKLSKFEIFCCVISSSINLLYVMSFTYQSAYSTIWQFYHQIHSVIYHGVHLRLLHEIHVPRYIMKYMQYRKNRNRDIHKSFGTSYLSLIFNFLGLEEVCISRISTLLDTYIPSKSWIGPERHLVTRKLYQLSYHQNKI